MSQVTDTGGLIGSVHGRGGLRSIAATQLRPEEVLAVSPASVLEVTDAIYRSDVSCGRVCLPLRRALLLVRTPPETDSEHSLTPKEVYHAQIRSLVLRCPLGFYERSPKQKEPRIHFV